MLNIFSLPDSCLSGHVRFIDYEYSSYNYQAFDIGNHFNEFAGLLKLSVIYIKVILHSGLSLHLHVLVTVIRNGGAGLSAAPQLGDADGLAERVPAGVQAFHQELRGGQPTRAGDALHTGQQVCFGEDKYDGAHSPYHTLSSQLTVSYISLFRFVFQGFSLLLGFLGTHPGQILLHRL